MGCKKMILLALLLATLITKEVLATQHNVGGSQGWDPSSDFDSWSSGQTFKVGDQLVFKYTSMHSVVELSDESAYKKCDISTPLNSLSTGKDVVKLDKPGTRYFTCGTLGHCDQGMKVKITVGNGNGSSSTASSPSSSSSSPSSSSSSTSPPSTTSSASQYFASLMLIVTLSFATIFSLF
ncbi:putative cupredoxin [Medicago truncatula]|uniref:Plastocyanin-like domain protein n=1 Tax=Medicago truncatula TaxID=3880 RepID=G7KNP1_MEDTR|nr:mavicyanin [Medicago truncatula]AES75064.1 plastocyanin-like domain protein [Medicago truncatula]AFK46467.1 unknown [Medicago truncatula]RHN50620.1 putative cupredoxin [Medicago truncatula]